MTLEAVTLEWHMFERLTAARSNFPSTPCVYAQADAARFPFRIGKASEGLEARYRGGTGYAIDAAMHGSGNLVFVAAVPKELCEAIESELIWQGRRGLPYNNNGKRTPPRRRLRLVHTGTAPRFESFEVHGSGTEVPPNHALQPTVGGGLAAGSRPHSPTAAERERSATQASGRQAMIARIGRGE